MLSDNGREFRGREDQHPYELFLQLEGIEHKRTRVRRPQSNGIIETGIAHGGSIVHYEAIMESPGHGRVIGIDVEIRPHNRTAIEAHPMFKRITLVEGSSAAPDVVAEVKRLVVSNESVMLILDSDHSRAHVAAEVDAYSDLMTPGSCILVQDGVMQFVAGMPRAKPEWNLDNPISAIRNFLAIHPEFEAHPSPRPFDETDETPECTHHPSGWLLKRR